MLTLISIYFLIFQNDSDNPDNPLFVDNPEIDDILSDNTNDAYDGYINAELLIPDQGWIQYVS